MKRLFAVILIALTVLSLGGAVGYSIHRAHATGGEPPVISFDKDKIDVTTDAPDTELMKGVTAEDPEDGDVTDSILVEGISDMQDGAVTVTYAAFDSQGHVARASRDVHYTDYSSPKFTMSRPMVFNSVGVNDMMDGIGAKDAIDGDITTSVRASYTEDASLNSAGEHHVELRVTNSLGDTATLTIPVRVLSDSPRSDQLPLKNYLVYLERKAAFDPMKYLQIEQEDDDERASGNRTTLRVDSNVDMSKAGVYTVDYSNVRDDQVLATTRLIVVVE